MSPVKKKGLSGPMNCPILAAQAKFRVHISLDKHTHMQILILKQAHTHHLQKGTSLISEQEAV